MASVIIFGQYLKDKIKAQKYCTDMNKRARKYRWIVDSINGCHYAVKLKKVAKRSKANELS